MGRSATVSERALNIGRLNAVSGLAQIGIKPQRIIAPVRTPLVSLIASTGVVGAMFHRGTKPFRRHSQLEPKQFNQFRQVRE